METKKKKRPSGKKHKFNISPILSILILIACGVLVWNYKPILNKALSYIPFGVDKVSNLKTIKLSQEMGNSYGLSAAGMLFIYNKNELTAYDSQGSPKWKKEFLSSKPVVVELEGDLVIADCSIGDIYIVSKNGEIKTKLLGLGAIDKLNISGSTIGIMNKSTGRIGIFDKQLKDIAKVDLPPGYMTSWTYSMSMKRIAMGILTTKESGLLSSVHQFDFKGNLQESVSLEDTAIYSIDYIGNCLRAISDNGITAWNMPDGYLKWKTEFKRTAIGFDVDKTGAYLVNYSGNNFNGQALDFENSILGIDSEGKLFCKVESLDAIPKKVKLIGRGAAVAYSNKLMMFDSSGKEVDTYNLQSNFEDLIVIDESHMGIIYKDKVEVIRCLIG